MRAQNPQRVGAQIPPQYKRPFLIFCIKKGRFHLIQKSFSRPFQIPLCPFQRTTHFIGLFTRSSLCYQKLNNSSNMKMTFLKILTTFCLLAMTSVATFAHKRVMILAAVQRPQTHLIILWVVLLAYFRRILHR